MFDKFTTIDHMLNHKTSFNNLEKLKLPIFYQNGIKLGIPNKKIFRKTILRLKNIGGSEKKSQRKVENISN